MFYSCFMGCWVIIMHRKKTRGMHITMPCVNNRPTAYNIMFINDNPMILATFFLRDICLAKCRSPRWRSFILAFLLLSSRSSASSTAKILIIHMMSGNVKDKQQSQPKSLVRTFFMLVGTNTSLHDR